MKFFLSLVLFCFCQVAFGAGTISITSITCTISDPTVTIGTTSVTFVHVINFTDSTQSSSGRCYFELSDETVTKGLTGGLQFATGLNSITVSGNAPSTRSKSSCGKNASLTSPNVSGRTGWLFQTSAPANGAAANFCTLSYTIPLMLDNTSPNPTNSLCPKITMSVQDVIIANSLLARTISFPCATPPITPQLTCSLSVPSAANIPKTTPQALAGAGTTTKPVNFTIAINCFRALSATFRPLVQMSYGSPVVGTCQAQNMAPAEVATTGVNAFVLDDQGVALCATNSNVAAGNSSLFFKTSTANQTYSDSKTLSAILVNVNLLGGAAPTPGVFTTTATFKMTFP